MIIEGFWGAVRQNNVCLAGVNWSWYFLNTVQVISFKSMHKNSFLWMFKRILITWFKVCLKLLLKNNRWQVKNVHVSLSAFLSVFSNCDFFVYQTSFFSSYVQCLLVAPLVSKWPPGSELSPRCKGLFLFRPFALVTLVSASESSEGNIKCLILVVYVITLAGWPKWFR